MSAPNQADLTVFEQTVDHLLHLQLPTKAAVALDERLFVRNSQNHLPRFWTQFAFPLLEPFSDC